MVRRQISEILKKWKSKKQRTKGNRPSLESFSTTISCISFSLYIMHTLKNEIVLDNFTPFIVYTKLFNLDKHVRGGLLTQSS
jgi:hypothetical protein